MVIDYRPFPESYPRTDCRPFWPTNIRIRGLRTLNRPCPLRVEQDGEVYLHTRRFFKDCGRAEDQTIALDPNDPDIKGSWFKLEPELARKLGHMDNILVEGYSKLAKKNTSPFEEQSPRFLRQLFEYFLYTMCPAEEINAKAIGDAPLLREDEVTDLYMREALLHCDSKLAFEGWLTELHSQTRQVEDDGQPDPVDAFANPAPPAEESDGDFDYEELIAGRPRRAGTAVDGPEEVEDSQSDEVYCSPKAAAEAALTKFVAEYEQAQQILVSAMREGELRRKDGSKMALDAYHIYRGCCIEAIQNVKAFIKDVKVSDRPNPLLERITSALANLQKVEDGGEEGESGDATFQSSLLSEEALEGEEGIKNAREAFLKSLGRSRDPLRQVKMAFEEYCKSFGDESEVPVPVPEPVIAPEEVHEHLTTPARSTRRRPRENSEGASQAGTPARRVKRGNT